MSWLSMPVLLLDFVPADSWHLLNCSASCNLEGCIAGLIDRIFVIFAMRLIDEMV